MNIGYFIDPSATPVTSAVLAAVKGGGGTEVYIRVKNADYKNHASELALVKAAGLKPFAWIWQGFSYTKEMCAAGWNIVMDMETYKMSDYVSEIKNIRSLTSSASKTFILCTKAQAWDGEQQWSTVVPLCDYIMPMLYLGDYGKTLDQLKAYAKTYGTIYPTKFYPVLETYVSDANVVAKSNADITAEIEACRPYCKGVGLFRYGLSNYKPEVKTVATQKQLTSGTVTLAQFQDMIKRFNAYSASHGVAPATVGIKGAGTDYVTKEYYGVMAKNYGAYQVAYGKKPATIEITLTVKSFSGSGGSTSTTGPVQTALLKGTNVSFSTFTQFYNLVKQYGSYSHYYDNQYSLNQEISRLNSSFKKSAQALNCVDYTEVGIKLAKEMGYGATAYGIWCTGDQINHAIFWITGKEFGSSGCWVDLAAAAQSDYALGSHWCSGKLTKEPSWIPAE